MDIDSVLSSTDLPEVVVDTDVALDATQRRGRSRLTRRRVSLGICAVLAVAGLAATALSLVGGTTKQISTRPGAALPPTHAEPGDTAIWSTDPQALPSPAASRFTALVRRLACNSGVTGKVLRPGIEFSESEVIVTFTVEVDVDGGDCPSNNPVPYAVELGQPLGNRVLVDGACAEGTEASKLYFCIQDGKIRWPAR